MTDASLRRPLISPGIRAMAISAFWFSVMGLLVKLAGRRIPSMQVVMFRVLITMALSLFAARQAGVPSLFGQQRKLLAFRGLMGATGLMCFYYSLVHLPLGEATLIQYTNPIFATLLAAIWIGERVGSIERWCVGAAIIGVALVARPAIIFGGSESGIDTVNVLIALLGAIGSGAAYATVRKIGPTEHPAVIILYVPLVALSLTVPFALSLWIPPTALEWLVLCGVGVTTQIAQVYLTRGLQAETTVRATTTGYLQVVFAALWGALLLGEALTIWTAAGAILIVGGAIVMAVGHRAVAGPGDE
jgi:drug/metabolite transporter (DMT)-like permease